MNPNILKNLGILLGALAAIGQELLGKTAIVQAVNDAPTNGSEADTGTPSETATGRGRGRPPKQDKPADSAAPAGTPAGGAAATTAGKTYEELRGLIEGPIKDQKGPEVKALIEKHAGAGKKLQDLAGMPEVHAAFIKDLDALSY